MDHRAKERDQRAPAYLKCLLLKIRHQQAAVARDFVNSVELKVDIELIIILFYITLTYLRSTTHMEGGLLMFASQNSVF